MFYYYYCTDSAQMNTVLVKESFIEIDADKSNNQPQNLTIAIAMKNIRCVRCICAYVNCADDIKWIIWFKCGKFQCTIYKRNEMRWDEFEFFKEYHNQLCHITTVAKYVRGCFNSEMYLFAAFDHFCIHENGWKY